MDGHNQRKTSPSWPGNRVCQRCRWPFPNPHPSPKHRRAHKRICGTLEGYELICLGENAHCVSSEKGQLSDEDCPTPSPKTEKKIINEATNRALGETPTPIGSEDGLSSETKAALSSEIEHRLEFAENLDETKLEDLKGVVLPCQLPKVDSTSGATEQPKSILWSTQIHGHEVHESALDKKGKSIIEDTRSGGVALGLNSMTNRLIDLSLLTSDIPVTEHRRDINAKADDNAIPNSKFSEKHLNANQNSGNCSDEVLGAGVEPVSEIANEEYGRESKPLNTKEITSGPLLAESMPSSSSLAAHKSHETDGTPLDTVDEDKIAKFKEKNDDGSGVEITKHDITSEVKPNEGQEVSTGKVLIGANSVENAGKSDAKLVKSCEMKGGQKGDTHFFFVENVLPVVDHPEALVEDFKDHGFFKSHVMKEEEMHDTHILSVENLLPIVDHPETLIEDFKDPSFFKSNFPPTLGEENRYLEEKNVAIVNERRTSNCCLTGLIDTNVLEENVKGEAGGLTIKEEDTSKIASRKDAGSNDQESSLSLSRCEPLEFQSVVHVEAGTFKIASGKGIGSNDQEVSSSSSRCETSEFQLPVHTEVPKPSVDENECSEITGGDHRTADIPPTTHDATSINVNVNSLIRTEHVELDDHNLNRTDNVDGDKNEIKAAKGIDVVTGVSSEVAEKKECSKNTETTAQSVSQFGDQPRSEEAPDLTKIAIVQSVLESGGIKYDIPVGMVVESNKSANFEVSEKSSDVSAVERSHDIGSEIAVESSNLKDAHSINSDMPREMTTAIGMGAKCNKNDSVDPGKGSIENSSVKCIGILPANFESAMDSSSTIGHQTSEGSGVVGADVYSGPLQEEGSGKHAKQQLVPLAVDASADSASVTDSLEGHWGSISVLSTQSESVAATDKGGAQVVGSVAPEGTESSSSQKLKTNPKGRDSDNNDDFEAPSFMTLVVPEGGGEQKAASEANTVKNTCSQLKLDTSQAGWFPSISNVVNESPGRKKNEEIIAKVTSWSAGKQQSPLRNFLGNAKVETKPRSTDSNPNQMETVPSKDEDAVKNKYGGSSVKTLSSMLESDVPFSKSAKRDIAKEWDSPARYQTEAKKEKRKARVKNSWVPFICCSSVQESS